MTGRAFGISLCIAGLILAALVVPAQAALAGATYSRVTGVDMNFAYSRTQSSQLGVAVSATGKKGSWTADGTHSTSNTGSEDFGTQKNKVSTLYKTEFKYGLFGVVCRGELSQSSPRTRPPHGRSRPASAWDRSSGSTCPPRPVTTKTHR
jgi:hypothetical protein